MKRNLSGIREEDKNSSSPNTDDNSEPRYPDRDHYNSDSNAYGSDTDNIAFTIGADDIPNGSVSASERDGMLNFNNEASDLDENVVKA